MLLKTDDDLSRLRDLIEGAVRKGTKRLPPEPKLSEELGISRGRLRTLLKRVEDEGLIWRHVGKGTFVGPRDLTSDPEPMSISMNDILDARLVLEPQLAAEAALHATAADVEALDACIREMNATESLIVWKHLDERLHRIIAEATHNDLLLRLYDTLQTHGRALLDARIVRVLDNEAPSWSHTDAEHVSLVEAIRIHDPKEAERCMQRHLASVRTLLFGLR